MQNNTGAVIFLTQTNSWNYERITYSLPTL